MYLRQGKHTSEREQKVTFSHLSLDPKTNSLCHLIANNKDTMITYAVSYAIRLIVVTINLTRQKCIKPCFTSVLALNCIDTCECCIPKWLACQWTIDSWQGAHRGVRVAERVTYGFDGRFQSRTVDAPIIPIITTVTLITKAISIMYNELEFISKYLQ